MSKNAIKVGDQVKIINPEFFVRSGYNYNIRLSKEHLINSFEKESLKRILGILDDIGEPNPIDFKKEEEYEKILKILAYNKLRQNGFGGPERKIFTSNRPELKYKTFWVASKKIAKTGIRIKNEAKEKRYDTILKDSKNNVILELVDYPVRLPQNIIDNLYSVTRSFSNNKKKKYAFGWNEEVFLNGNWIESKNVRKVNEPKWKKGWK